jgi:hypothetical protein
MREPSVHAFVREDAVDETMGYSFNGRLSAQTVIQGLLGAGSLSPQHSGHQSYSDST